MSERVLILTVGTGRNREDIARSLAEHSITHHNPDRILLFGSSKSNEETAPLLHKFAGEGFADRFDPPYTFDDFNNVSRLFEDYRQTVQEQVLDAGVRPEDVYVDFTSGTKPMSAALTLVASHLGLGRLLYVSGQQRDEGGRARPGTEMAVPSRMRAVRFQEALQQFQRLFDNHHYRAAGEVVAEVQAHNLAVRDPERVALFDRLARFYAAWDGFDLEQAVTAEDKLTTDDAQQLKEKVSPAFGDAVYPHTKQIVGRMRSESYSPLRMADLVENAERRLRQGAYADAMLRLYRGIEYLAQFQLHRQHKLNTSDLDLSKLPDALRASYEERQRPGADTVTLSMLNAYRLLRDLDDPLGKEFMETYDQTRSDLKRLLNKRNQSILAHGFEPVQKEHYTDLRDGFVLPMAETFIPDFPDHRGQVRFPTFT